MCELPVLIRSATDRLKKGQDDLSIRNKHNRGGPRTKFLGCDGIFNSR